MPAASVIIAAGGRGTRFQKGAGSAGPDRPRTKVFAEIRGEPVLLHTLRCFERVAGLEEFVVAVPAEALDVAARLIGDHAGDRPVRFVEGGEDRLESVARALEATHGGTELVVIHDAVRPLVRPEVVEEAMRVAVECGAAVVGRPVDHTVKRVPHASSVVETVPREGLWLAQTPQVFRREIISRAYGRRGDVVGRVTDDAQLVEAMGGEVRMVPGDAANFKITTPEDLRMVEALLAAGWPPPKT